MKLIKPQVNLADIAKLAGCTAASVSLVLNESPLPSARMREKVKRAAEQLGYVPNRMARSLKRGRTFTLGVVMPYCADNHVSPLLDALSVEAAEFGYQLEIHFHRWSVKEEDRALKTLGESRAEGIFLSGSRAHYKNVATIESLRRQRIPVIGMMRQFVPEFAATMQIDRYGGAAQLGRYLVTQGHRHIDYLESIGTREAIEALPPGVQSVLDGLHRGVSEKSSRGEVHFFPTRLSHVISRQEVEEHGFSAQSMSDLMDRYVEDYLKSRSSATAVVFSHIALAWKLLAALSKRKRHCPKNLSIACINVEGMGALGAVPLTSAEYSVDHMARKGMAAMLAAIAEQKITQKIKIPTVFKERLSVATLGKVHRHAHI